MQHGYVSMRWGREDVYKEKNNKNNKREKFDYNKRNIDHINMNFCYT